MESVKLVIFDMDGLIFDTEWQAFNILKDVAEKEGFNFTLDFYKTLIGISDKDSRQLFLNEFGESFFEKRVMEKYVVERDRIFEEEGVVIKPGALELLDTLDAKGIKRGIASSSEKAVIRHHLEKTGLINRFDFYVSGLEVERGKPFPDIFLEACKLGGVEPKDAIVLEDSYHGLLAATRADIRCIVVPDLIDPNEEMKKLAYRICKDLGEVAKLLR